MGAIEEKFEEVYRDFATDGVASSGAHKPKKSEQRALGQMIETAIANAALGALIDVTYATAAELAGDLEHAADSVALVYADAADANNDLWRKTGASGGGGWTNTGTLHSVLDTIVSPYVDSVQERADVIVDVIHVGDNPNVLALTPKPGNSSDPSFTYRGVAGLTNTGPMIVDVSDVTAGDYRQVRLPDGVTQVPRGLVLQDQEFTLRYSGVTGLFTLLAPTASFANDVPLIQQNADPATFQCRAPNGVVIIDGGARANFTITAPADRDAIEPMGVTLEIEGFNDGDARQVLHPDGTQIAPAAWKAGDKLTIGPLQSDGKFRLLYPPKSGIASANEYADRQYFYSLRSNQIAAQG